MFNFIKTSKIANSFNSFQWHILSGPILILIILSMVVVPLPSFILDLFFTFNIALSIMILLSAMFTKNILEFAAFPSILLFSTLLRLALNVASTRIILLNGHTGSAAAGYVVESFGHFLVGGNFVIGSIVFIILVIINFMVITKGAGRIAEVGARFILDGMPGKQMAIDADLNAGIIGENEAKNRRMEISQEADFYGSMDGASKFVRGDAIAGILIMIINVVGGLVIAVFQHQMQLGQAAKVYTLLTIGDGLVAQIPALVISTAAGVIVTRVTTEQNVGEQIVSQLLCDFRVIFLSSIVLGILGLVPGMPNFIFLFFSSLLMFFSWKLYKSHSKKTFEDFFKNEKKIDKEKTLIKDASWKDVRLENVLGIELGSSLLSLIDSNSDQDLKNRISLIRKKFTKDIGFLPSRIHIYNNPDLEKNNYRILIRGVEVGYGIVFVDRFLSINSGNVKFSDDNISNSNNLIHEPAFGLDAYWIDIDQVEEAKKIGYTVVSTSVVIVTHLNKLMLDYSHKLFGREEAKSLLECVSKDVPKLVEDLIPNLISLTVFHRVVYNLLFENVPIRDIRTIIETLIEQDSNIQNQPQQLTVFVRIALGKIITQKFFPKTVKIIEVITLDHQLEKLFLQIIQSSEGKIEPGLSEKVFYQTEIAINKQKSLNLPIVLLVRNELREYISYFLRQRFTELTVISNSELYVDDKIIKSVNIIGKH
ncbi:Flagellar biosynthesis protein FlhA [Buchnera aphidicola (Tetraneura ulmi)]|uniref:flagellar biosynthesis protein FlhA n=1 Tax=Buchnera aphidicola TaxID=9 RepID=UPI0034639ECF